MAQLADLDDVSSYMKKKSMSSKMSQAPTSKTRSINGSVLDKTVFMRWNREEKSIEEQKDDAKSNMDAYEQLCSEQITKRHIDLEKHLENVNIKMSEYETQYRATLAFLRGLTTPILPEHANNFILKRVYVSSYPSSSGVLSNLTAGTFKPSPICPVESQSFFKSKERYAQGDPPYSSEPKGDLTNTYINELKIDSYSNPYPFSIGIELTHNKKPIGEKHCMYNGMPFHYVLHPNLTTILKEPVQIYRTSETVNSPFAQQFPNLVADREKIERNILKSGPRKVSIPITDPITYWLFKECAFYKNMSLPEPLRINNQKITKVETHASTCQHAVNALIEMIHDHIPVINMLNVEINYTVLDHHYFTRNTEILCHKISTTGEVGSRIPDPKSINLGLSILYMFKEHYGDEFVDSLEHDDENAHEYQDDSDESV